MSIDAKEDVKMKCDKLKAFDVIINDDYKTKCYTKADVDAAIAELKDENRKLKRVLWLARAERALSEQYVISNAVLYLENKFNHKFNSVRHELHVWGVVKRKCRSKAKEYE